MRLHVESFGSGSPIVVLHGAPTTPSHMRPLAERLGRRWRALLLHLPGYGASAAMRPYVLEDSLTAVEETLRGLGVTEAAFVGLSGGSYRCFAHALRGRVRARAVVALGAVAEFPDAEAAGLLELSRMLRRGDALEPIIEAVMLTAKSRANSDWRTDVLGWAKATPADHLADEFEAFAGAPSLLSGIAGLDVPILLRVGELDAATPSSGSERIAAVAKRATLEVVEGIGHAILCEDFDATASSIEDHLEAAIAEAT